jgi:glycosyl transferase family 25
MDEELKNFPKDKVHRVSGVEDKEYPYLGCTKGHLNAIKLAVENGWENVLILEDDAMWSNIDSAYPIFEKLVKKPYDVIMLGGTMAEFDKETFKVFKSKSSASYLINKKYYNTILRKEEEVISSFKPGITKTEDITPDVAVFYPLQAADSWFIVSPALMVQQSGYSSILKKETNYKGLFS